jgi:hypothetical protein
MTQKVSLGIPPHYQAYLDKLTPEGRQNTIKALVGAERREKRKHNIYRKYMLKDFGEDIGPYDSLYDWLWREEKRKQVMQSPNYTLLGLVANADLTKREVKNAYRRKARKMHPDTGGDAEQFKALHTAYRNVLAITKA